ncbi:MAG: hypothetical protein C0504_16150 [Candidatus Solibacter sp.]|nr:hypothetical protein [Candidatus Solibacter sp.]
MRLPILQLAARAMPLLIAALPCAAWQWADRGEYDMALAVRQQPDAKARIELIGQWKQKYPASKFAVERAELELAAALPAGDPAALHQAAAGLLAVAPESFNGLYWLTLLAPSAPDQSPAALSRYESAARRLLPAAGQYFTGNAAAAPEGEKQRVLAAAHRTLGWVAWRRANLDDARASLLASLELDPARADVSAWLGAMLSSKATPEHQIEAVWRLARASYLDGPGALVSTQRREVRSLLDAVYTAYRGSADGLDAIGAQTRDSLHPPANFRIESAAEAAERVWEEQMLQANPSLRPYLDLRKMLLGVVEADLPNLINTTPLPRLRGTVLGCNEAVKATEIQLGITGQTTQEVLVKLDGPLPRCPDLGASIELEGSLFAFTGEPFLITVTAARKAITAAQAAPPPTGTPPAP